MKVAMTPNLHTFVMSRDGEDVSCSVIMRYEWAQTGREYIVYTDDTRDEDGHRVFRGGVLRREEDAFHVDPISTDAEKTRFDWVVRKLVHAVIINRLTRSRVDIEDAFFRLMKAGDEMTGRNEECPSNS